VVGGVARKLLPILEVDPLDVEVPDKRIVEPVLLVGPDTGLAVPRENIVDFECLPDVDEIIELPM